MPAGFHTDYIEFTESRSPESLMRNDLTDKQTAHRVVNPEGRLPPFKVIQY